MDMVNIAEIRKIIESSPQISIDSVSQITSHVGGLRSSFTVKKDFIVDYEKKEAKVFTSISGVEGRSEVKEFFHNQKKNVSAYGLDGRLLDSRTETFTEEQYSSLFSHEGELKVVDFDVLVPNSINKGNNVSFHTEKMPKNICCLLGDSISENDVDMSSNVLLTICSEDTLKINSLAYGKQKNQEDSLLTADTEIIIHLCENCNLLF